MSVIPRDYNGFIAVLKRDCATCRLIEPAILELSRATQLQVHSQDDASFPESVADVIDERELELSYRLDIEVVPTLIRLDDGRRDGAADRLAA